MRSSILLVLLFYLYFFASASNAQLSLNIDRDPAYVDDIIIAEISIDLNSTPLDGEIEVEFPLDLIYGEISGRDLFKNIKINEDIFINESSSSVKIIRSFQNGESIMHGVISIPLRSEKETSFLFSVKYAKFLTINSFFDWSDNKKISIIRKPVPPIIETTAILNISSEFKNIYPTIYKFIDKDDVFKNDSIYVGYLIYNPYKKNTTFYFDDHFTFDLSGFKTFNESIIKNSKFNVTVPAEGLSISYYYMIYYSEQDKKLILPSKVTFENESGNIFTRASEPFSIEVTIKNKPPQINEFRANLINQNIDLYNFYINCNDTDGRITELILESSLDGLINPNKIKYDDAFFEENLTWEIVREGAHEVTLTIKDNDGVSTVSKKIINKDESLLKKIFYIFVIGSFFISLVQLIANWEKILLWISKRFSRIIIELRPTRSYILNNFWFQFKNNKIYIKIILLQQILLLTIFILIISYILYIILQETFKLHFI